MFHIAPLYLFISFNQAKEEEPRKVAYDILLKISSTLRDIPSSDTDSSEAPYEKLISMVSTLFTEWV